MTTTKRAPELTITKATSQARRIVDKTMSGVLVTVDSKLSHDLDTDTPLVITTITYPASADASDVACWAERAPGVVRSTWDTTRIVVTRKR